MVDMHAATSPVFEVGGRRVADLGRDCVRLEVEETTAGLRTLSANFLASAPGEQRTDDVVNYLDGRVLDFGAELAVSLGPPGNERVVFGGQVSALEVTFEHGDAPMAAVFAEDALMKLRMTRRSRTYRQVSDADVARRVADDHGLAAEVAADGPRYPAVHQINDSDLAFLRDRAALIGAELWASGGTLHLTTRDHRPGGSVTLAPGPQLPNLAVRADLAHQRTAVRVSGYDARRRDRIDAFADDAVVRAETGGGMTGIQVLSRALGQRPEQCARLVPLAEADARAWARAGLLDRARRFITVVGTAVSAPELAVGSRLTLDRVPQAFAGDGYYVTRVRHTYTVGRGGLRTHFEAERSTINGGGGR